MGEPNSWDSGRVTQSGDPWFESTLSAMLEDVIERAQALDDGHCSQNPTTSLDVVRLVRDLAKVLRDAELERVNP